MNKAKPFNSRPMFYSFLALTFAVASSRFVFAGNLTYIILDAVVLAVFLVFGIRWKAFKTLVLLFCVFLFGLGWFFVGLSTFEGKEYAGVVQVSGRISDDVEFSKYGGSATVILKDVKIEGKKEQNIRLTIKFENEKDIAVGNRLAFSARVEKSNLFELGQFQSFQYRDRTPYTSSISMSDALILGNHIRWDESFRLKVKSVLFKNMGSHNGAVAYAMLFGDKTDLEDEVYESYRLAGILHLLTVSGLHVSFLVVLLGFVLRKLKVKRVWNFLTCFIFIALYATLCNFSPSIMRAGIMGLVLLFCSSSGKNYDALSSIGLAGIVIVAIFPLMPLDLGFLMSFFSVLTCFVVAPWLGSLLSKIFPRKIAQGLAISISAELAILPFVAEMFSVFNFLSFFVNLFVVPFFGVLFPFIFVCTIASLIMSFMGFLLKVGGWGLLLIEKTANFFGQTRLKINLEPMAVCFVAALFVGVFLLSRFYLASRKRKITMCSICFSLAAVLFGLGYVQYPTRSAITYGFNYSNSVVVLTSKNHETVIVDLGYQDWTRSLLNRLNIQKVDTMFVLQDATIMSDTAEGIGVTNIIRCDDGEGYDGEMLVNVNEACRIGAFSFTYHASGSRLVGLEIAFDDTCVFIMRDWKLTDKQLSILPISKFDFVLLGKHPEYAKSFDKGSKILTYYSCDEADSSVEEDGNIEYVLTKKPKRRCLD